MTQRQPTRYNGDMSPISFFVHGPFMVTPRKMTSVWDVWLERAIGWESDRATREFLIVKQRRIWKLYGA